MQRIRSLLFSKLTVMNLFETSMDSKELNDVLYNIQDDLTKILNNRSRQVSFEEFYRSLYIILQNQHGNQVHTLTYNRIEHTFAAQLDAITLEGDTLLNIFQTLDSILKSVDRMMKVYFYFEEAYYLSEKNTSLKIIAYDILKHQLVKKESLFFQFLNSLTTHIFKCKNGKANESKEQQTMAKVLDLIHKLDAQPSKIHIFNHYLKDFYIKYMVAENRQRIQALKENYNPKEYFITIINLYRLQEQFIRKNFLTKKTELILNDIIRCFYSNWISQNWSYLFNDNQAMNSLLRDEFLVVYNTVKLDDAGFKQFTSWYIQTLNKKLKSLKITDNQSLVQQFTRLYLAVSKSITLGQDNLFVGKVKIVFENWINAESINIVNRLVNHINSIILKAQDDQTCIEAFKNILNDSMVVFKFVKDKDLFQLAYARSLLHRMSTHKYYQAIQEAVLKLIGMECGQGWTDRILTIMKENSNFQLPNIVAVNQIHWHALTAKEPHVSNPELIQFQKNAKNLQDKNTKWLLNYGRGILNMRLGKSFQLHAPTRSLQLLLYFNNNSCMIVKNYLNQRKYDIDNFRKCIFCLVKSGILISSNGVCNLSDVSPNLSLSLNLQYCPQSESVQLVEPQDEESLNLTKKQQLTEDRKLIIESIITKLIKSQKTSSKSRLIQQTMKIVDQRGFSANIGLIESSFDPLEDRGYIKVVGEEVSYIP